MIFTALSPTRRLLVHACRVSVVITAASMPSADVTAATPFAGVDIEFFETRIRPLLTDHCGECHGPDTQWADLRVDSRETLVHGGASGAAIVPGDPEHSLLIRAVRRSEELQMPPDEPLSDAQIALLEEWIRRGAPWPAVDMTPSDKREQAQRSHWAFQPLSHPEPPAVAQGDWPAGPIDSFVLAKLEAHGLAPAPVADRRTLIRRVSYSLTGLPPTPEEVDAFVNDYAPDAYERLVDRLLASPRFGEHWARHWLDVARYSDTKGYVYGREERFFVHSAAYRDWVVESLNDDMPFDRFLVLQLAADQAAPDDRRALAAMGYLTLGRRFLGVTHDIIDDRIDVVCRGMLGLTVACARCHDHKFDPIPTQDYYSLYGVFLNCTERLTPIADPAKRDEAYESFEKELHARQAKLKEGMTAAREAVAERTRSRVGEYLAAQLDPEKFPDEKFSQILTANDLIPTIVHRWQAYLLRAKQTGDPVFAAWHRFAEVPPEQFAPRAAEVARMLANDASGVNPLIADAFQTAPRSMQDVAERYAATFTAVVRQWGELKKVQPDAVALPDPTAEAVRQALYGSDSPCVVPDEPLATIEWYFDTNTVVALWQLQGEVERWLIQSPQAPPYAWAVVDRDWRQEARVFRRGSSANKGEAAPPRFLKALSPKDRPEFTHGSGRLDLAQAIASPENPLTARVWVNRVWAHHFGAGLVRTPSDFGLRAEPPSHPELLDWLASEFIAHGWSTKWLQRAIVTSAAYQQASTGTDAAAVARAEQVDPENRLLWRANVHRLSFEEYRDTLLAAAGDLDLNGGGRGTELFTDANENVRRTIYGLVDRQFLAAPMRTFDFANPDLHTPQRSETTVSQQALFAMNHPFMGRRARGLAKRVEEETSSQPLAAHVRRLYQLALQREPTISEAAAAAAFLESPDENAPRVRQETLAWTYGYGELNRDTEAVTFNALPRFTGAAWQGGPQWPDAALGWVQLTATGGHAGNDLQHAAIRRWTAPRSATVAITSEVKHETPAGDGIRCWIVVSRGGVLKSSVVHHQTVELNVERVTVEAGDTIDLITDFNADLNNDQFLWSAQIRELHTEVLLAANAGAASPPWNSTQDFGGEMPNPLNRWQQLAQVLLMSNELMFVD